MKIQDMITVLESIAPPSLQEGYDNAGLLTGQPGWDCSGVLVTLDATEAVIQEAIEKKCNLVVAHHPIIFGGLKKINGKNYVERTVIAAIKQDIAIYAIHTNLDNVLHGVNAMIADAIGLVNRAVLQPKSSTLKSSTALYQAVMPSRYAQRFSPPAPGISATTVNAVSTLPDKERLKQAREPIPLWATWASGIPRRKLE